MVHALPDLVALASHPRYVDTFDLHGFVYYYYYYALVTAQGQLLPYPAGEAPRPLSYVPWSDGIAAVLSRLHRELPQARFVVAELGYGGAETANDQARCTYLRQTLKHIGAAQDAGMRIEGVTLWRASTTTSGWRALECRSACTTSIERPGTALGSFRPWFTGQRRPRNRPSP